MGSKRKQSNMTQDYSQYSEPTSSDALAQLGNMAVEMTALETKVVEAERALKVAQEDLRIISEKTIPDAMDALGIEEFTARGGLKIRIGEAIRASIPKARQEEAVTWLDAHGFAALVKRKFVVQFGKDEEKWANKFAADLAKRKRQLAVAQDKAVHPSTLSAFVREQLEEGADLPLDLFGVFRQRFAKLEVRK